ncbi:MAG: hypothetical protein U9R08_03645 [Nanoarchaeota archaeon]|nr:hypothetical protein [Nanoarchaeota archaeon]
MATNNEESRTSVKLRISTTEDIKKIGVMGETYDDVISRLIKLYNGDKIGNKGKSPKYVGRI